MFARIVYYIVHKFCCICTCLKVVDEWCVTLKQFPIHSLEKPLRDMAEWHKTNKQHVYKFDQKGMQVYRLFANEMADKINEQWEQGKMAQGNVSKDNRTMVRLVSRRKQSRCHFQHS